MGLLDVSGLTIRYADSNVPAVSRLDISVSAGESLGIVGESGSGKTQTALAIMGLLPGNAITEGSIRFDGEELAGADANTLNRLRPRRMAMVFQDPMAALNPYVRIGDQLRTILTHHGIATPAEAERRVVEMLAKVGLPDPERQYGSFPHQLSGGMRQRALIASALICDPDLLVADEPTTALDMTIQAQILHLLGELRQESNAALLLITHDLGVIAGNCERMLVVDKGRLVEEGPTARVFAEPAHARTAELIAAVPRLDAPSPGSVGQLEEGPTLLDIDDVSVSFRERRAGGGRRSLHAVLPLSLEVSPGETVAIVGESGSGKTSLARAVLGLLPRQTGSVSFLGRPLTARVQSRPHETRRQMQMVFQDPVASLDPAMRVGNIIAEPLKVHDRGRSAADRRSVVMEMLERVGLDAELEERYPHELSGGQAQRVAIARSLVTRPAILICDEAVAALDGTVRREVLDLLQEEQRRTGLSLIMITHDLGVVRRMSHRVLVMYMGRVCELTDNETLFARPRHPYTRALIDSVPVADPAAGSAAAPVAGEVSSILDPPTGCVFHPRCAYRVARCAEAVPALEQVVEGRVACHRTAELDLG